MTVRYKFEECPKDPAEVSRILSDVVFPLFKECWDIEGKKFYGKDTEFEFGERNAVAFMRAWQGGLLNILVAYDEGTPVGFLLALHHVPLMYSATVLHVEVCYASVQKVKYGLYDLLGQLLPILSPDEVMIPERDAVVANRALNMSESQVAQSITTIRLVR